MKIKKLGALLVSAALCAGMAAPAFAFEGEAAPVEQPVLPEAVEDVVTVTDEISGALTPEGNLTLVDDYHTNYSDGSGQQFITLVSKSGNTFYLVIDRNAKGQQTVHFMNLVDEADLLALMEEEDADAYTAEKEAAAQAELERKQAEEDAKKADKDKPEWQKEMEKRFEEFLKKDTERESAYKALKEKYDILEKKDAESARANTILSKAKELGIPEWRIKEGFAISAEADEAAINSHLTTVATNLKTANLPSNRLGHVLDDGKPSKEQISDIANSLIH